MKVLVACEESQAVCLAFRSRGHEAYSCDIQSPSGPALQYHIKDDVLKYINGNCTFTTLDGIEHTLTGKWDLIIAHPPCTYLSNAGARWLYPKRGILNEERYQKGLEAKEFFMKFYNADCDHICIENPMPSSIFALPSPSQVIHPYQFDSNHTHPYTKKTLLWLKGLRNLVPTTPDEEPVGPYCPSGTSRKRRDKYGAAKRGEDAKNRAKTFVGIAEAFADQFGKEINNGI